MNREESEESETTENEFSENDVRNTLRFRVPLQQFQSAPNLLQGRNKEEQKGNEPRLLQRPEAPKQSFIQKNLPFLKNYEKYDFPYRRLMFYSVVLRVLSGIFLISSFVIIIKAGHFWNVVFVYGLQVGMHTRSTRMA
jgi:hypothetical protein